MLKKKKTIKSNTKAWNKRNAKVPRKIKPTKYKDTVVNGYKISWNDFWKKWQVSHPEIGFVAEFRTKALAITHAKRG